MTLNEIVDLIFGKVGAGVFLLLALIGIYREWWFPGPYVRKMQDRIDRLQEVTDRAVTASQTAADHAEHMTTLAEGHIEQHRRLRADGSEQRASTLPPPPRVDG